MTVKHTMDCVMYQRRRAEMEAEARILISNWLARWGATYCHKCNGMGGFDYPGTYDDPPDYDVCSCVDAGLCPRCGKQMADTEDDIDMDKPCAHCGWNWGRGAEDTLPYDPASDYEPMCACELEEFERAWWEGWNQIREADDQES